MDHCSTLIVSIDKILTSNYTTICQNPTYKYLIEKVLGYKDEETSLYTHLEHVFFQGVQPTKNFNIRNLKDIADRLRCVDTMLMDVGSYGIDGFPLIEVIIDDVGNLVLWEGNNRLAVCACLGISHIPVYVTNRSTRWLAFKQRLFDEYNAKKLYNPINHPDFADWEVVNQSVRFANIKQSIKKQIDPLLGKDNPYNYNIFVGGVCRVDKELTHMSVVDLCCHYGYFSHAFCRHGYSVTGVEHNAMYYEGAKYLNHYNNHFVDFVHADVHWYVKNKMEPTDITLLLNIIYHLIKDRDRCSELLTEIGKHSRILVTDYTPDKEMSIAAFKKFIKVNTGMHFVEDVYNNPVENRITMLFMKGKVL